jgi:integrase
MSTSFFVYRHKRRVDGELIESRTYTGRLKIAGETRYRHIALGVTDKRVAEQKLAEVVRELERESVGLVVPRSIREAFAAPFADHVARFLEETKAKGRAPHTVTHYRTLLRVLSRECGWKTLRDVTPRSFCEWRARSKRSPKYLNDLHGVASSLLTWLERREMILANPLKHVEKVANASPGGYRRALSALEIPRLLAVAPPQRAWVYLVILYTGLRRHELNRLTWGDFQLETAPYSVSLSSTITKNRKAAVLGLRPEVVEALRRRRPADSMPFEWVFRGKVPAVSSMHRDLLAAGIPVVDERGRKLDVHALRTTYGTMLSASGVSPRVAMELMRHSDLRLTMRVYTDAAQLPMISEVEKLPSYALPPEAVSVESDLSCTLHDTLTSTQTGVSCCHAVAHTDK